MKKNREQLKEIRQMLVDDGFEINDYLSSPEKIVLASYPEIEVAAEGEGFRVKVAVEFCSFSLFVPVRGRREQVNMKNLNDIDKQETSGKLALRGYEVVGRINEEEDGKNFVLNSEDVTYVKVVGSGGEVVEEVNYLMQCGL